MKKRPRRGFSLPELMVSITIFSMVTTLIVLLYHSVTVAYRHNFVRLENSDRAREAIRRVVPLISSGCPFVNGSAIYWPDVVTDPSMPGAAGLGYQNVILSATKQFIENFIFDSPAVVPDFVPFRTTATEFGHYRVYWLKDTARSAKDPAGQIGDIWVGPQTDVSSSGWQNVPTTPASTDRCVARSIYGCSFYNCGSNRVLLTVDVYGVDRTAINRQVLQRLTYRTEVWLPFYSNTTGNS